MMTRIKLARLTKRLLALCILVPIAAVTIVVMVRGYSALQANAKIYALENVPSRPVGIVFGAEVYTSGSLSDMLADRVKMGVQLYQQGKIGALLFTGDNHIKTYDEPEAMRDYAIKLGVPANVIVLDYAGFRTYDSCYRARDIFKVSKAILVTQAFHLDRALLICNSLGIDSIGVAADVLQVDGYSGRDILRSQLREFPSTTLAVIDLLRSAKPTFLGEPLPILAKAP
jgi:SanA protein